MELARDGHQKQQRAAGAIIPPNAHCLQWLSGEWQIECTHAKGYLGDQVLFSGGWWWWWWWGQYRLPVFSGGVAVGPRFTRKKQRWRRFSAADSAELVSPAVIHYVTGPVQSGQ